MFTRRIFDGVIITGLALHLAVGIPRMWARKDLATHPSGVRKVIGRAIVQATS